MKQKLLKLSVLLVSFTILIWACKKEEPMAKAPEVGTLTVSSITTNSFDYQGTVTADGGAEITAKGICYGTEENPTLSNQKTVEGKGKGEVKGTINDLTSDKVYYARVYATNSAGTTYGTTVKVALQKLETLIGAERAYPGKKSEVVTINKGSTSIKCKKIDGKYFYQGDILIDPNTSNRGYAQRAAIDEEDYRWKNNTFVYKIDPDFPDKQRIYDAFKLFDKTNIVFKERTDEKNYALFQYIPEGGCYSWIGMLDEGEQEIVIDTWAEAGTVAHEIGHALGLIHEQSRPDRDKYIKINYENIIDEEEYNFDTMGDDWNVYAIGEFDFNSIMLYNSYGWYDVAIDINKPIMTKLDGSTFNPQRKRLTEGDIEIINYLYPKLEDLTIEKEEVNLEVGQETSIKINTGNGNYTIENSNKEKATATLKENTITLTAKAEGTATITVKDTKTEQTQTIKVTVSPKTPDLAIEKEVLTMEVTEETTIKVTAGSSNYTIISSDDEKATTTEKDGVITVIAKAEGLITVNIRDNKTEQSKTINITIEKQSYIELTTTKVGEEVEIFMDSSDQKNIWIDLNANGKKDTGEKVVDFSYIKVRGLGYLGWGGFAGASNKYTFKSQTIRIYGKVTKLLLKRFPITNLEVSHNKKLEVLYLSGIGDELASLDVSQNTELKILVVGSNSLTDLDVSNNKKLKHLEIRISSLKSIDVSQNLELQNLGCYGNQLTHLNLSKNVKLKELDCSGTQLTNLDLSNNTKLGKLDCRFNKKLNSLDVSRCPDLGVAKDYFGHIYQFDCTDNPNLTCIKVSQEQLDNTEKNWKKDDTQTFSTDCN